MDKVKILFLSSNPNITDKEPLEEYPDWSKSWTEKRVEDYFINCFDSNSIKSLRPKPWTKELKYLRKDGQYVRVTHWTRLADLAAEFLNKPKESIKPGLDFAISEVVHCKSKKQYGVKEALDTCINNYLDELLKCATTQPQLIVCMGKYTEMAIFRKFGVGKFGGRYENNRIYPAPDVIGKEKWFFFMPHPSDKNAKSKSHKKAKPDELRLIHKILDLKI